MAETRTYNYTDMFIKAVSDAHTFDDFLNYMQFHNYKIKMNKYLSFKTDKLDKFIRAKSLGTAYTEKSIRDRISGEEMANRSVRIYADKTIKMPHRKMLKLYKFHKDFLVSAHLVLEMIKPIK